MTWEIFNEPEWKIWFGDGPVQVKEADISAMASAIIASIRASAPSALVTVGSALIAGYDASQHGLSMWTSVDLDYYSPHWYDLHVSPVDICALCTTAAALQAKYGTSRPIVIGEFQEGSGSTAANVARLNQWYDQGYAGAWAWSLFPQYTGDGFTTDLSALSIFDKAHSDIGPMTPP
jgi:hypothetical protein